jgi:hypothetical protein
MINSATLSALLKFIVFACFPISRFQEISLNVQAVQKCLNARRARTESRGVLNDTLSDTVRRATPQLSVFQ